MPSAEAGSVEIDARPTKGIAMSDRNYWTRLRSRNISRRMMLKASARAGVGAAGLALVGCGGDDDDEQQAVAQAQQQQQQEQQQAMQQQQDQPQQQQAMQQEQAEQQAEQQAMQQEQQEQAQTATAEEQQQAAPQPAAGETDLNATVRAVISQAAGGLDILGPGGGQPQTWMHYDTLGQFDQFSKDFVASAATFEWVDDFTAGLVHMKEGMTWHDGAPVTAEDLKFSLDRTGGIGLYNADGKFDSRTTWKVSAVRDEISVMDDLTARVPLLSDASAFAVLGTEVHLIPKHIVEEIGDEAYNNTGGASGPFRLVSYAPDDQVTSVRFEDYHVEAGSTHRRHTPWFAEMQQIVRPEPLSRVAALEADEADMALALPPDLAETFLDSDDFWVLYAGGIDNWNISMNTLRPLADGSFPFQDIRVRRAMNHAVNIDAIIDSLTGQEKRAYGISSSSFGYMTDEQRARLTYEYNPDKARALLAEAGYPDGFHTPFWGHKGTHANTELGAQIVQQDLEKVGITSDLQVDVHAVFRPRLGLKGDDGIHDAPGLHFYFINHFPDPVSNINAHISEDGSIAHGQYPDSGIQQLVEATRSAFDPAERAQAINDLAVAVYENASFLFLIEPIGTGVLRNNIEWINHGGRQDHFNYWGIRPLVT